ncbi:unnamed protein product, partial [Phaeothamnion confervicola]
MNRQRIFLPAHVAGPSGPTVAFTTSARPLKRQFCLHRWSQLEPWPSRQQLRGTWWQVTASEPMAAAQTSMQICPRMMSGRRRRSASSCAFDLCSQERALGSERPSRPSTWTRPRARCSYDAAPLIGRCSVAMTPCSGPTRRRSTSTPASKNASTRRSKDSTPPSLPMARPARGRRTRCS